MHECNANQITLAQIVQLNFHMMFSEKNSYLSRTTQNETSIKTGDGISQRKKKNNNNSDLLLIHGKEKKKRENIQDTFRPMSTNRMDLHF